MDESLGERLRRLRLGRGMKAAALARAAGLSRQEISDIELGKRRLPGAATLGRIAGVLGVSLDELLSGQRPAGQSDEQVLLAQAEVGRLLTEARQDFPNDDDYRLFYESVLRNLREMRELARLGRRSRPHG